MAPCRTVGHNLLTWVNVCFVSAFVHYRSVAAFSFYFTPIMLNKNLATFLAIFLGIFGTHQFYVGKWWYGALHFGLFFFGFFAAATGGPEELIAITFTLGTLFPVILGLVWASMPKSEWHKKYGKQDGSADQAMYGANLAPADSSELKAEGIRYYRSADYDLAVEAFTEAVGVDYGDPGSHFNLACSFAQLGRYPEALQHLELSVTFGLPKPQRIEKHPALGAMRKLPAFQQFRSNNYRRQDYIGPRENAYQATILVEEDNEPVETIQDFGSPPLVNRPSAPKVDGDLLEQISRLRELHDAGILTPKEYQLQKERLLG